jgi:hypothetical protein
VRSLQRRLLHLSGTGTRSSATDLSDELSIMSVTTRYGTVTTEYEVYGSGSGDFLWSYSDSTES